MRIAIPATASGLRPADDEARLGRRRSTLALLTIWIAVTMAVLDGVIVNVALPTISLRLGVTASTSIWVINGYQLAITVALLPCAALGDRIGYRSVYLAGLGIFTLASLACALSQGIEMLVTARIAQGLGAGAVMSLNAALLRFSVPEHHIGRMLGRNAIIIAISTAVGPGLAGVIIGVASWPWLFAINVPLGMLALALGGAVLPRFRGSGTRMDWVAALLNALTFGSLILGAEQLAHESLTIGAACLTLGLVAGMALVRQERAKIAPLVPLDLLRIRLFALSTGTSMTAFTAHMIAFVCVPFYFQQTLGLTAIETAALMTPWPVFVGLAAAVSGRLADSVSPALLGGFGLGLLALGLLALSVVGPGSSTVGILWPMALSGAGFGVFQSPNNRVMILAAPKARSGAAGGALSMARLLGQTLGALVVAIIFHSAGVAASRDALAGASALAVLAAVVSLMRLTKPGIAVSR